MSIFDNEEILATADFMDFADADLQPIEKDVLRISVPTRQKMLKGYVKAADAIKAMREARA